MELAQIQKIRDSYGNKNKIRIYLDSSRWYDNFDDSTRFVWDDANQLLYTFRVNADGHSQRNYPLLMDVTHYSAIDAMISPISMEELDTNLLSLVSQGLINDTDKASIIQTYIDAGVINNTGLQRLRKIQDQYPDSRKY